MIGISPPGRKAILIGSRMSASCTTGAIVNTGSCAPATGADPRTSDPPASSPTTRRAHVSENFRDTTVLRPATDSLLQASLRQRRTPTPKATPSLSPPQAPDRPGHEISGG